jgi:hypothetical protein
MMSEPEREEAVEPKAEAVAEPEPSADRQVADTATEEAPAEAVEANEPEAADETRESAAPAAAEAGDEAKDTEAATQTPPVEASQEALPDAESTDVEPTDPPSTRHRKYHPSRGPPWTMACSMTMHCRVTHRSTRLQRSRRRRQAKCHQPAPTAPRRCGQRPLSARHRRQLPVASTAKTAIAPTTPPPRSRKPIRTRTPNRYAVQVSICVRQTRLTPKRKPGQGRRRQQRSRTDIADGTVDAVARETTTRHWQRDDSGPVTGPGFAPDFLRHTREREQASATTTKRKLPGSRRLWTRVAVVVLGLGVLIQGAYLGRSQLAGNIPVLRPVLEAACEPFGCSVPPWRDLEALRIDTSQLQKQDESDDVYLLAVTMRNQAAPPRHCPPSNS